MRTVLKWVGSKSRIIDRLKEHLPTGNRLVEPFGGSCAVMMNTDYDRYLIGDVNQDLINFHQHVADYPESLIDEAKALFESSNTETRYYTLRDEFNTKLTPSVRRSAIFLYLNRHCFNGLCRYNNSGLFNVPYGRYPAPYFPEEEILAFNDKAPLATFMHAGWLETLQQVKRGDVVYIDPPYIPLSATSNFVNYAPKGFGLPEQRQLAEALLDLGSYGIPIVASNSGSKVSHELYKQFKISTLVAPRSIGGVMAAKEIIATLNI